MCVVLNANPAVLGSVYHDRCGTAPCPFTRTLFLSLSNLPTCPRHLQGFVLLESELAEAYDYVSPCFPPHYNIFDSIFQMYHVQFAQVRRTGKPGNKDVCVAVGGFGGRCSQEGKLHVHVRSACPVACCTHRHPHLLTLESVYPPRPPPPLHCPSHLLVMCFIQAMDIVGQVSPKLSTAGQLRLMQWVCGYQQTLRGLGVQEVRWRNRGRERKPFHSHTRSDGDKDRHIARHSHTRSASSFS